MQILHLQVALHLHQVKLWPKASCVSHAQSLYIFKLNVVTLTTTKKQWTHTILQNLLKGCPGLCMKLT